MDFAALPPEVNSARMYAGAGAGPLLAAASSWSGLATELAQTAADHSSTVTALAAAWIGPSATAMTAASTSYTTWLTTTAEQAAQTASQAQAAVAAYGTAFAATVNPALIVANRTQLMTLSATNFLGINTAAIMATEAQYAEMWAQDVAAMTGYQASSQAATSALPQFTAAPQTTNPAGIAAQSAATTQAATTPAGTVSSIISEFLGGQTLPGFLGATFQSFVSSGPLGLPLELLSLFAVMWGIESPASPLSQAITNRINAGGALVLPEVTIPPVPAAAPTVPTVGAQVGAGERLGGRLSVPPNWAQQREPKEPPAARPIAPGDPHDMSALAGLGGLGGLGGLRGGTPQKQNRPEPQYGTASTVMPKHPYGG